MTLYLTSINIEFHMVMMREVFFKYEPSKGAWQHNNIYRYEVWVDS